MFVTSTNSQKKKEMKEAAANPSDIYERELYFKVVDEEEMKEIVTNGFKCEDTIEDEKNLLSTSEMGIHFSKNADIVIRNEYKKRKKSFYIVLAKVLLNRNKGKLITPDFKNRQNDPDNKYVRRHHL